MRVVKLPAKIKDVRGHGNWKLTSHGPHVVYKHDKTLMMVPPSRVGVASLLDETNVMEGELSGLGKVDSDKIIDAFKDFVDRVGKGVKKDRGFVEHEPIPIQNVLLVAGGAWLLWKIFEKGSRD